jgi:hypothetical protein
MVKKICHLYETGIFPKKFGGLYDIGQGLFWKRTQISVDQIDLSRDLLMAHFLLL